MHTSYHLLNNTDLITVSYPEKTFNTEYILIAYKNVPLVLSYKEINVLRLLLLRFHSLPSFLPFPYLSFLSGFNKEF